MRHSQEVRPSYLLLSLRSLAAALLRGRLRRLIQRQVLFHLGPSLLLRRDLRIQERVDLSGRPRLLAREELALPCLDGLAVLGHLKLRRWHDLALGPDALESPIFLLRRVLLLPRAVVERFAGVLGGRLGPNERLGQLGDHHLLRLGAAPVADLAVPLLVHALVDEGADARDLDVVDMVEVVAQVELVELEGDDEGREVGRLLGQRADKCDDVVWPGG